MCLLLWVTCWVARQFKEQSGDSWWCILRWMACWLKGLGRVSAWQSWWCPNPDRYDELENVAVPKMDETSDDDKMELDVITCQQPDVPVTEMELVEDISESKLSDGLSDCRTGWAVKTGWSCHSLIATYLLRSLLPLPAPTGDIALTSVQCWLWYYLVESLGPV